MSKLKIGYEFFITLFVAIICSLILLGIIHKEETFDDACMAIEKFDHEAAVSYIDKVRDVDGHGLRRETMLMVACKVGNARAIEYLISRGADVNKTLPGNLTPLELFCRNGYDAGEESLLLLLDAGAMQSDYSEKPAIFHLAENFNWMSEDQKAIATEQAILLLQHGAPLGYGQSSLLHFAAKSNMADLFYTVVHTKEGLSTLTMKDENGCTPWDIAVNSGSVDVQVVIRNLENEYDEILSQTEETVPNETVADEEEGTAQTDETMSDDFEVDEDHTEETGVDEDLTEEIEWFYLEDWQ